MANTLTNLIPSLYAGLNVVSRELVGFIPAVTRDTSVDRAAVGQNVYVPIAPAANVSTIAPAMSIPEPTDQTIGSTAIAITNSRAAEFGFVGEEVLGLNNNGPTVNTVQADMFAEGVRALINEVEDDLFDAAAASGATTYEGDQFASDTTDSAQIRKVLDDAGTPPTERSFVLSTETAAFFRVLMSVNDAKVSENDTFREQGSLATLHGMMIRESAAITGASSRDGFAFSKNALVLAARAPALPEGGDVAESRFMMVDPRSGLPLEIAVYKGYRKVRYEVSIAWGVKVIKAAHMAILLNAA